MRELVDRILRANGLEAARPEVRNEAQREIRHQYLTAEKARRLLGWKPLFTLDEGLERTIAWYREFLERRSVSHEPRCRSCGTHGPRGGPSLGETPLANALVTADRLEAPEARYPLDSRLLPRVQPGPDHRDGPPGGALPRLPRTSPPSRTRCCAHARELVGRLIRERGLGRGKPGDGGGEQRRLPAAVLPAGGRAGARHRAGAQRRRGGRCGSGEFPRSPSSSAGIWPRSWPRSGRRADVLHANNVLAHVADLNGFVAGIRTVLKDDGVAAIEVPYLGEMIPRLEFDTIYHEHLCYFSLTAAERLLGRHDLAVADVEEIPFHGGSLLLTRRPARVPPRPAAAWRPCSRREADAGMTALPYYAGLRAACVAPGGSDSGRSSRGLKAQGQRLAAYGAAAKGSTLLNYAGVGRETIDFVVDRSTHKQGQLHARRAPADPGPARRCSRTSPTRSCC